MENHAQLVDKHRKLILDTFEYVRTHPETGFREWKTNAYLTEVFESLGYTLTQAGNIPGFYTDIDTGRSGPTVLVMAEEDALIVTDHPDADPETGAAHACGHCAQVAALVGIAAALREPHALDGLSGKIRLMAVPAEELIEIEYRQSLRDRGIIQAFGGKQEFMRRGYMDGVDMAFMIHTTNTPTRRGSVSLGCNGCVVKLVEFQGVAAHAGGSPHKGVNALYAANLALNAINALRETFTDASHTRVHPILTSGGSCVNVIPDSVCMESYVRGVSDEAIVSANDKVNRAIAASAAAMGANAHLRDIPGYFPLSNDPGMADVFVEAMGSEFDEVLHRQVRGSGCTDAGDLSSVMPTVHPYVSGAAGSGHGPDYRIVDPETACVTSAKVQVRALQLLLQNGAERAQAILQNFTPVFPSIADYIAFTDRMDKDVQLVTYQPDGSVLLNLN